MADRDKTTPFLVRAFVKVGGFHRLSLFEDNTLPSADEFHIYSWKDSTLPQVLTSIRIAAPSSSAHLRHPLAKFAFRAIFADPTNKGRVTSKELGTVYSRDILGEPGSLEKTAPRLLNDEETTLTTDAMDESGGDPKSVEREYRPDRTLDDLRFVPGDYLDISVILPKNVTLTTTTGAVGTTSSVATGATGGVPGWKAGGPANGSLSGPLGRGGGHWRGGSDGPGRGRGGRGAAGRGDRDFRDDRDRDRDIDRRVPPPRRPRDSPPRRRESPSYGGARGRSRSRSRTPPRRRNSRYD